jgi:DNA-binding transcriptional MerR regulator
MPTSANPPELYKIKTIASLSGFNPTLLRAWERRYGLLEPLRTSTGHRLYTREDLKVLQRVRQLLDQGRSIGEVVAQGRAYLLTPVSTPLPSGARYPELERLQQEALESARQLDQSNLDKILERAFASLSPLRALDHFVVPLLSQLRQGDLNAAARALAAGSLQRRLHRAVEADTWSQAGELTLVCGLPDDFEALECLVLAYALKLSGRRVIYLGPALPFDDLVRALPLRQPQLLAISASCPKLLHQHLASLKSLTQALPLRLLLAGSGTRQCQAWPGLHLWCPPQSWQQLLSSL